MTDRSELIAHALGEIERVRREGGTARVALPNLEPDQATVGELDQRGAATPCRVSSGSC